jgi:hypothetical protein
MPFANKQQYQYLAINEPEVFKKFKAEDKREFKDLPDKVTEDDENAIICVDCNCPLEYCICKILNEEDNILNKNDIEKLKLIWKQYSPYAFTEEKTIKWLTDNFGISENEAFNYIEKYIYNNKINEEKKDTKEDSTSEINEFGLVDKKNLDDLLNDEEFHKYFENVENFDKATLDLNGFFDQKDIAQTNNQLQQYLQNLNYGDKAIQKACEILSMTTAEKKDKTGVDNNNYFGESILKESIYKDYLGSFKNLNDIKERYPNNKGYKIRKEENGNIKILKFRRDFDGFEHWVTERDLILVNESYDSFDSILKDVKDEKNESLVVEKYNKFMNLIDEKSKNILNNIINESAKDPKK